MIKKSIIEVILTKKLNAATENIFLKIYNRFYTEINFCKFSSIDNEIFYNDIKILVEKLPPAYANKNMIFRTVNYSFKKFLLDYPEADKFKLQSIKRKLLLNMAKNFT